MRSMELFLGWQYGPGDPSADVGYVHPILQKVI